MTIFLFLVDLITISSPIEIDAGGILQMFGKMFFEFCQESGYDTILRVLGSNVREFLQVRGYCFYHPKSAAEMLIKWRNQHCLFCLSVCIAYTVLFFEGDF